MKKLLWIFIYCLVISTQPSFSQTVREISLKGAIQLAKKKNPEFRSASEDVRIARADYWLERTPGNPEFSVEYEEVPIGAGYNRFGERKLIISQDFDFPFHYWFRHGMFSARVTAARAKQQLTERQVVYQVTEAYYSVVLQQKLLQLARREVQLSQEFYSKIQKTYEVGETDRLTLLRAKVNLGVSRQRFLIQQRALDTAMSELRRVLAIKHYEDVQLVLTDTTLEKLQPFDWENAMPLVRQHPALRLARANVQATASQKRLAYLGWLPSFSISYYRQTIAGEAFQGGELGFSVPLWFWRPANQINKARAQWQKALYANQATQLSIKQEFDQAKAEYDKAMAEVELYENEMLREAEEAFRIARQSRKVGEIGFLDFIDAQKALISVREGYYQALFRLQIARALLTRLTGS